MFTALSFAVSSYFQPQLTETGRAGSVACLDAPRSRRRGRCALDGDPLEKHARRLVVRILRHELAAKSAGKYRASEEPASTFNGR